MKNLSFLLLSLLISQIIFPQEILNQFLTDSTKPVQYRRGVDLQFGYQRYEEKYASKNLNEEKRRLFPLQSTGVWTELNPRVPRVDYLGIHFVNKDTGWACGDLGALIKTSNGGSSWTVIQTNETIPILKVRSYNGQVVIASGYGGTILRSTDGGETFVQVTSNVTGDLWGLQMVNDTLGWACGNVNSFSKTTDGGQTWQRIFTPGYTSDYWWIDFLTEQYGFIAANGKVLKTMDGGNSWEIIQAGDNYPLFCIDMIDSLHIAAAGYGDAIYRAKNIYSNDGGNTWINGGNLTWDAVNCIQFVNADTGYLTINEAGIYKTTNRGQDWSPLNLTGGGIPGLFELQFHKNINLGYAAGIGLRIYRALNNLDAWNKLIINDNFVDVYFTNETTGYAAANRIIYKTTNAGLNWFILPNFPSNVFTASLNRLTFTNAATGFAGGYPARIVKTTDAGDNWYVVNRTGLTDTIGTINKIFFINSSIGWAVTSRGGILKTTDAGNNWFAQLNVGVSIIFNSVYFVDSLYGWTANSDRPFKTTDGGTNWVQQTNSGIWQSRDVFFTNRDTGWIVDNTSWSLLKKTIDGGINWIAIPEILNPFEFHFFPDPKHWIINGTPQKYITEDGGYSWIDITTDVPSGFNNFNGVTDFLGFAVGELGIVLRYFDETVPVELMDFTALIEYNKVSLNWITASETNNNGFFIERIKVDENYWKTLTFINGAGTSTNANFYSYRDRLNKFGKYKYRLKQIDYNGQYEYSNEIEVDYINKFDFYLSQNYPNPYNPATKIDFNIPEKTFVRIILYDVTGREIKKIIDQEMEAGNYSVSLSSEGLSSGVYFYKMITGSGYTAVNKLTIIK